MNFRGNIMFDESMAMVSPVNQRPRDYARQRQMGIGDLLLENRIVFLDASLIHDVSVNLIVTKLLFLPSEASIAIRTSGLVHQFAGRFWGRQRRWPFTTPCNSSIALYRHVLRWAACRTNGGGDLCLLGGRKANWVCLPRHVEDHDSPALRQRRQARSVSSITRFKLKEIL